MKYFVKEYSGLTKESKRQIHYLCWFGLLPWVLAVPLFFWPHVAAYTFRIERGNFYFSPETLIPLVLYGSVLISLMVIYYAILRQRKLRWTDYTLFAYGCLCAILGYLLNATEHGADFPPRELRDFPLFIYTGSIAPVMVFLVLIIIPRRHRRILRKHHS